MYSNKSLYSRTGFSQDGNLDLFNKRFIPKEPDDLLYTIKSQYAYRPDLLSFDLYGTAKLWWVFAARNMNVIKDPVFDFLPGTQIFLPKKSTLTAALGI
jgi:hypothetical protein